MALGNGEFICPGHEVVSKIQLVSAQLDKFEINMEAVAANTERIANSVELLAKELVNAAIGKDHIPMKVGFKVINTLLFVVFSLVFIIGTLLIGAHFDIIGKLIPT